MSMKWIDNFEGYEQPVTKGVASSTDWLGKNYLIYGNTNGSSKLGISLSAVTSPEQRTALFGSSRGKIVPPPVGNNGTGSYAVALPLSKWMNPSGVTRVYQSMKIIDLVATVAPSVPSSPTSYYNVGSMSVVVFNDSSRTSFNQVITILIQDRSNIRVTYAEGGEVKQEHVELDIPMFGTYDTLEYMVEKVSEVPNDMSNFSLWINNKLVLSKEIFNNVGSKELMGTVLIGTLQTSTPGASSSTGYIGGNPTTGYIWSALGYGITDLGINTDAGGSLSSRLGKLRIATRYSTYDAVPNTMEAYAGSDENSHAELVSQVPPNPSKYLSTETGGAQEMYGSGAFPGVGNEAVLGLLTRVVARKEDPGGLDIVPVLKVSGVEYDLESRELPEDFGYVNDLQVKNPATDLDWTVPQATAAIYGVKIGG